MNRRVKKVLLGVLRRGGVLDRWSNTDWRRRRLLILGYHGVSLEDEHEWDPSLYISPANFAHRLELLRDRGCSVLPLCEGLKRMCAGTLPDRAVALTFDDGTYDFYARAYPILEQFGYPATVYLTTYYSRCGRPVFDVSVSYLLWKNRGRVVEARGFMPGFDADLDLASESGRERGVNAIRAYARSAALDQPGKDECLTRLAALLGVRFDTFCAQRLLQIMNGDEVARLAAAGIDFQLHTHRHRVPVDAGLFAREIEDNRTVIAEMTGTAPDHFCYPSNVHRPEFLPWLKALGVVSATTSDPGLASADCHALLLPRMVDSGYVPAVEFESWLCGFSGMFHRPVRHVSHRRYAPPGGVGCKPEMAEADRERRTIRTRSSAA